ncbi:MAG: 6-hydroxymethylpterin diphosphokinase MptE-like protein [Asgard group archaeon]|nr:6-hydroxymethylpterin diphosphokinase MptE-like protein [Asgard group archaeon]
MKRISLSKNEYQEICHQLQINPQKDKKATRILQNFLKKKYYIPTIKTIRKMISGKDVLIFAPGPTLEKKIEEIGKHKTLENKTVIAVNGASQALLQNNIASNIIISDLDGSLSALRKNYTKYHSILVIHAHGDNIHLLRKFKENIQKPRVIGSTQTEETTLVKNYGGFTDGDRAVYFAANFDAKRIFLLGFDFGYQVGKYSKPRAESNFQAPPQKEIKFSIAKNLLTKISKYFPNLPIFTVEPKEKSIPHLEEITLKEFNKKISE